jgi:extracellular factor (EF) 3-hydroxypalmitic acid methyl ester biosynthesis protein
VTLSLIKKQGDAMTTFKMQAFKTLDKAFTLLRSDQVDLGLTNLNTDLYKLRRDSKPSEWEAFTKGEFLTHPLTGLIHQDPFTRHSFDKPRNYAGDADLLDFMYGIRKPDENTSELGQKIFSWAMKQSTVQSVRYRREILASKIDELAECSDGLRILSIASGHLREAFISRAVRDKQVSDFYALDQDALSLEVVSRELSEFNVRPVHTSVKRLFKRIPEYTNLDFVYAAGLYDYLPQKVAVALTKKMFEMLKPGGKLLVANFAPTLEDSAFGETYMQWKLIYRDESEVADFTSAISAVEIADTCVFRDEPGNVIYLEITK